MNDNLVTFNKPKTDALNQHFNLVVGATAEQSIRTAIAGRTPAQVASDVDQRLRTLAPDLRSAFDSTLVYINAKVDEAMGEALRCMQARINEQDSTIEQLNSQVLNTNNYAVAQAVRARAAYENMSESDEKRFRKYETAANRLGDRVDNVYGWKNTIDKQIREEMDEQVFKFQREMVAFVNQVVVNAQRDLEGRISQEFAEERKKLEVQLAEERNERKKKDEELKARQARVEEILARRD